jgi:hypothetical protein
MRFSYSPLEGDDYSGVLTTSVVEDISATSDGLLCVATRNSVYCFEPAPYFKTLGEWSKEIYKNAAAHSWHDEPRSFAEIVALCHSELSEALEEYRSGRPMIYGGCNMLGCREDCLRCGKLETLGVKPEGKAVEMIDCLIRILDWCGAEGIDVDRIVRIKHEYNKTRPFRHGGKVL